ncbi:hypothetical protein [Pseudaminobacter soli (ex Li et al. 2025)]|uniref:Uncharacterized protein n=1 Tax=Pseudaminobacter soli (ex Li et al. 2025) TaxID=1295366 RepID=A0A2P7SE63_9HYPH|nr:hypothetical protein [Mesorhizobium soli]PSJ60806.1 hypothetical protein C7I85_12250 [Mesorhizobium soli]
MTSDLIARLEGLTKPCNKTDILVEIALFKPDRFYASIRVNDAGTKVIYTSKGGRDSTYWAGDHTLSPERRARSIAALRALEAGGRDA